MYQVQLGERLCGIAEDESFILDRYVSNHTEIEVLILFCSRNPVIDTDTEIRDIKKTGESEERGCDHNISVQDTWRNSPTWDFLIQRSPRLQNDPGSDSDTDRCRR